MMVMVVMFLMMLMMMKGMLMVILMFVDAHAPPFVHWFLTTWDPELEVWLLVPLAIEVTLQEERSRDLGLFDFITTRRSSVSTLVGEINNLLVELKAFDCQARRFGRDRNGEGETKTAPVDCLFHLSNCFPLPKDWPLNEKNAWSLDCLTYQILATVQPTKNSGMVATLN